MKFLISMVIVLGLVIVGIMNKPVIDTVDNSKLLERMERECDEVYAEDRFDFLCSPEVISRFR